MGRGATYRYRFIVDTIPSLRLGTGPDRRVAAVMPTVIADQSEAPVHLPVRRLGSLPAFRPIGHPTPHASVQSPSSAQDRRYWD